MSAIGQPQGPGMLPPDRRAAQTADDPGAGEDLDEYIAIDPIEGEMENEIAPDGSLIVYLGEAAETPPAEDGDFYANLADVLKVLRPALARAGLSVTQFPGKFVTSDGFTCIEIINRNPMNHGLWLVPTRHDGTVNTHITSSGFGQ